MQKLHKEVIKLHDNIRKHSSEETANTIAYGKHLPLHPTQHEKKEWVNFVAAGLESKFDEKSIREIRLGCYCNENGKLDQSKQFVAGVFARSNSLGDFIGKMNDQGVGWTLKDNVIFTYYDSCSCPMLEGVDHLERKTWCYCTLGFNQQIFENVLGVPIEAALLKSIKMGDDKCVMSIRPLEDPFD